MLSKKQSDLLAKNKVWVLKKVVLSRVSLV
jgi:hypothetical protein